MPNVRIPTPLRPLVKGQSTVEVGGATVRELLANLDEAHAGFRARICDDAGELRRFVNMFVNDEDVRSLSGLDTEVKDSDVISIVPAIAGGAY